MSPARSDPKAVDPLASDSWSRCEGLIESFEQAWRSGPPPIIEDYLRGEGIERDSLLVELAHVDLELRLKAGESARVEAYLDRFPRLLTDSATVLDLLEAEYELRRRAEREIGLDEYARRFPAYVEDLRGRLTRRSALISTRIELDRKAGALPPPEVPGYEIIEEIG